MTYREYYAGQALARLHAVHVDDRNFLAELAIGDANCLCKFLGVNPDHDIQLFPVNLAKDIAQTILDTPVQHRIVTEDA